MVEYTSLKDSLKKNIAEGSMLSATLSDAEYTPKALEMVRACEENEALRRVEAF
jgi:type II secretory pathway component PulF